MTLYIGDHVSRMSKDESTKDIVVTKNKTDSFFQVSKNCVPYRPLPRWLRQNQYPLYLPEICEPLWSERVTHFFKKIVFLNKTVSSVINWGSSFPLQLSLLPSNHPDS